MSLRYAAPPVMGVLVAVGAPAGVAVAVGAVDAVGALVGVAEGMTVADVAVGVAGLGVCVVTDVGVADPHAIWASAQSPWS